jgi:PX domain
LHEKLQKEIPNLGKDLLPGKKIIKNEKFLEQRRQGLEKYLSAVLLAVQLMPSIPLEMIQFLDLDKYDIVFLLQRMALDLSHKQGDKAACFTILEVS